MRMRKALVQENPVDQAVFSCLTYSWDGEQIFDSIAWFIGPCKKTCSYK